MQSCRVGGLAAHCDAGNPPFACLRGGGGGLSRTLWVFSPHVLLKGHGFPTSCSACAKREEGRPDRANYAGLPQNAPNPHILWGEPQRTRSNIVLIFDPKTNFLSGVGGCGALQKAYVHQHWTMTARPGLRADADSAHPGAEAQEAERPAWHERYPVQRRTLGLFSAKMGMGEVRRLLLAGSSDFGNGRTAGMHTQTVTSPSHLFAGITVD